MTVGLELVSSFRSWRRRWLSLGLRRNNCGRAALAPRGRCARLFRGLCVMLISLRREGAHVCVGCSVWRGGHPSVEIVQTVLLLSGWPGIRLGWDLSTCVYVSCECCECVKIAEIAIPGSRISARQLESLRSGCLLATTTTRRPNNQYTHTHRETHDD